MSDLMFFGVLRMPYEMAMENELSRRQFYDRAREAADRVEAAERRIAELESRATSGAASGEVALLQWRVKDIHPNTVTTGQYSDWNTCNEARYDEIVHYRDNGYPHYEVRKLAVIDPAPAEQSAPAGSACQGGNTNDNDSNSLATQSASTAPGQAETERDAWKRLLQAVKVYAFNYLQDEAEEVESCTCGPKQHAEAKELFATIAALSKEKP